MTNNEPSQLRRGKAFHKPIQDEWLCEAADEVVPERHVIKPSGRRGRVDVFVSDDDPEGSVAIVEIKATDWDRIKEGNVRRNVPGFVGKLCRWPESERFFVWQGR